MKGRLIKRRRVPDVEVRDPEGQGEHRQAEKRILSNSGIASTGASTARVSPRTISRAATSPMRRCWTMWTQRSSSPTWPSGEMNATRINAMPLR